MVLKQSFVILLLVTSVLMQEGVFTYPPKEDFVIICNAESVTVKWRPSRYFRVEPLRVYLGTCPSVASAVNQEVLLFSVSVHECGFQRLVVEDKVTYNNVLTYQPGAGLPSITMPVQCDYEISDRRTTSEPMKNDLVFNMEFMNSDFSGAMFTLGSRIAIRVEAEHQSDTPVKIYLHDCVLAKTPDLNHVDQLHTLFSDVECLGEGQGGNLTFLPRQKPSEIRFYFQAPKFALEEPIFLHCKIMAWDLQTFTTEDYACHYLQYQKSWEPLEEPGFICSCCDSICINRSNIKPGISTYKVLGPFTMVDPENGELNGFWTDEDTALEGQFEVCSSKENTIGHMGVPVWVIVLTVFFVLMVITGAIATSYYLCIWRGGRLGYRPSRDLLNKY